MNNTLLENCDTCYLATLSELPASLIINGALQPSTNYILKVTDKFGNKFSAPATGTDGSGNLTVAIPVNFPINWLNHNAGKFLLEVSKTAQPWQPETLTFGANTYTCIIAQFVTDPSGINTIQ